MSPRGEKDCLNEFRDINFPIYKSRVTGRIRVRFIQTSTPVPISHEHYRPRFLQTR